MAREVGLFVTCLVDLVRPSVGFAAVKLLEAAGCRVVVPRAQTCCGQPAYNSGARAAARQIAVDTMRAFRDCAYVVAPSGSCAAMLRVHYPKLMAGDVVLEAEARDFAARVHELTSFLVKVCGVETVPGRYAGRVVYHDACSGLRELGVRDEPRRLLAMVPGLDLEDLGGEACCGFGGLFSIKYPEISNAMVSKVAGSLSAPRPDLILAGDLGCLMNIAGKLRRGGSDIACRHVSEVLAGECDSPPIAAPGLEVR